jgi:hypothetical protein
LAIKVPLSVKFPSTVMVPEGAVKVLVALTITELNATVPGAVRAIAVTPSNVVVLFPGFRIPVTARFPAMV